MKFSILAVAVLLVMHTSTGLDAADSSRPNILYFYVDDMGWGSIGPNGQAQRKADGLPYVRTPNLDALARAGVNFTRGYGCHVCSPARSSQQSGFHQGHTFADRNDPDNAKKAMRADDVLMGDVLSKAGYVTGYWGKWGYGGSKDQEAPEIQNVQTLPTSHGYQHVLAELHHVRAHTFFQPTLWQAPAAASDKGGLQLATNTMSRYAGDPNYPSTPALQNHADYPKTAYCDDSYAFAALEFVRAQALNRNRTGTPFFGLLAVQIPHAPFGEIAALPNWDQEYANDAKFASLNKQTLQWAAMVTRIDAHFGNILQALEDPNNDGDTSDSVAKDTLVIFQSDNGGPRGKNNQELDANGGLRGVKGEVYEGGIRVPLVMRWPAKIHGDSRLKAGSNCERVVDVTDLLPTFCDLAGESAPLGVDGVSIAPLLSGEGKQRSREFVIHESGKGASIISGRHKLVKVKSKAFLYDLVDDPAETKNLASERPKLVSDLRKILIDERVDEPHGFATTYHHWIGDDGKCTSLVHGWSEYAYANEGITYMEEKGPPKPHWIARIESKDNADRVAVAAKALDVLALEIGGNVEKGGSATLKLNQHMDLTARNELNIAAGGILEMNQGEVSSMRPIDVMPLGYLVGNGRISADLANEGIVKFSGPADSQLEITGDYEQGKDAVLAVEMLGGRKTPVEISGDAKLDGALMLPNIGDLKTSKGESIVVLTAESVSGVFADFDRTDDFAIQYTPTSVTIVAK